LGVGSIREKVRNFQLMRVLFLNQYFPPDPAPTGILFREIADELVRAGHAVDFVDAGEDYRGTQQKGGRMRRELAALRRMLKAGQARERADVVVSGTSPPCLAVVADRVARKHGARHLHWAMDVYPEIAVALGEIRARSLVTKITGCLMGRAYRRCAKVVALDADMAEVLRKYRVDPGIVRPWVFRSILAEPLPGMEPEKPWTWLYSGNLGRAHEWETLLQAQLRIEQRSADTRLVFQGGGPSWPLAQARATELGLRRVEWRGYAPESELRNSLLRADVLVATQRPEVRGLLWPSKLALMRSLPRAQLFIGPPEGAIAAEMRRLPHAAVFSAGDASSVAQWVAERRTVDPATVVDPKAEREVALAQWLQWITGPGSAPR
jgi:colanic acid biosynthesis glycosyl transferase WcaI